jgi:hypothetical protein
MPTTCPTQESQPHTRKLGTATSLLDVVHVGDLRCMGEAGWRLINECLIEAEAGLAVGLVHHPLCADQAGNGYSTVSRASARETIHPEVEALVTTGAARGIDAGAAVSARLLTLHDSRLAGALWQALDVATLICIVDPPIDPVSIDVLARSLQQPGRTVYFQGVDEAANNRLRKLSLPTVFLPRLRSVAKRKLARRAAFSPDAAVIAGIGETADSGMLTWSDDERTIPSGSNLSADDICFHRFLTRVDHLVVPPMSYPALMARAHGLSTSSSAQSMVIGPGRELEEHGPAIHRDRLAGWLGRPVAKVTAAPRRQPRILLISSNGVGLGHLTRLLAIARRLPKESDVHFLTMSHALPIVEQAGYSIDYLPFHAYANCNEGHWNDWLADEVGDCIDLHASDILVYDGGQPYPGIIRALGRRPQTRFVWLRRGMWQELQDNAAVIARQFYFDLVIEPADIAEAYDRGATIQRRDRVVTVDPIRLLDRNDLLSKKAARSQLGLDPTRPACLIQLGAGTNRDVASMVDSILLTLAEHPGIQPVIAEWLITPTALDLWPGTKRLKGFPLSRYFNAFDFSISAAGYNSYNEILSFGLPSIFIANEHAAMDDQEARARFAQDNDAAFHLPEYASNAVAGLVNHLLDANVRRLIKQNCRRLARPNGASQAADAIARLHQAAHL